ncbi:MAG: NAD(P)-dependent alcohol dehydrogenase [Terriglobia bacterium]|jgi:NADPH:quinone reductase-like Zn-dependent oxidoreductase
MKAIVYDKYGPPEVLKCEEIDKPSPGEGEVLIKVHAASMNPYDWHFMRGLPYFIRLMAGLAKPKERRLGVDGAGYVEAVGRNVTLFKAGDTVFGACRGAFGEYACASERALARKPDNVSFEQAASVPIAGLTALQGLRDKGKIQPGSKVLVNGASGGVGTFAVQIAKSFGAEVTGVCSTRKVKMVRSIGADEVIDYTQEDFTRRGRRYDLIFDCIGNHSLAEYRRVMNPKGIFVGVGGATGRWMLGLIVRSTAALLSSPFTSQKFAGFMAKPGIEDLTTLAEFVATGKVTPVIDRRYGLNDVPEAIRYLETGHVSGKVVIALQD